MDNTTEAFIASTEKLQIENKAIEGDSAEAKKIEAIKNLLEKDLSKISVTVGDESVFTFFSSHYGLSRRHVAEIDPYNEEILLQQTDRRDKYDQKIGYRFDELDTLLAILLTIYLDRQSKNQQDDDGLGDLDDHPF